MADAGVEALHRSDVDGVANILTAGMRVSGCTVDGRQHLFEQGCCNGKAISSHLLVVWHDHELCDRPSDELRIQLCKPLPCSSDTIRKRLRYRRCPAVWPPRLGNKPSWQ